MEKFNFIKMQGVGNDYIFIDERKHPVNSPEELAVFVSNRRFSVGGDGLVLIGNAENVDCKMTMFNSDGSRGATCGNALRCLGRILHGNRRSARVYRVLTDSGVRRVEVCAERVTVDMGTAQFKAKNLPVGVFVLPSNSKGMLFTSVSVGNPHAVSIVKNLDFDVTAVADEIAKSNIFPEGVNVEFAKVEGNTARIRVVERGSGETFGCGSGACAVASVMKKYGLIDKKKVEVISRGGSLFVEVDDDYSLALSGEAKKICKGVLYRG